MGTLVPWLTTGLQTGDRSWWASPARRKVPWYGDMGANWPEAEWQVSDHEPEEPPYGNELFAIVDCR
jgi:hypothetical protein